MNLQKTHTIGMAERVVSQEPKLTIHFEKISADFGDVCVSVCVRACCLCVGWENMCCDVFVTTCRYGLMHFPNQHGGAQTHV
jgi:hypothetical protein